MGNIDLRIFVFISLISLFSSALPWSTALAGSSELEINKDTDGFNGIIIFQVFVDFTNETLTIHGINFKNGNYLNVKLGQEILNVTSASNDEIIADLPQNIIHGDYLLSVITGANDFNLDKYNLTIGAVGPQGLQGIQGAVGPQGPKGIQGEQGTSEKTLWNILWNILMIIVAVVTAGVIYYNIELHRLDRLLDTAFREDHFNARGEIYKAYCKLSTEGHPFPNKAFSDLLKSNLDLKRICDREIALMELIGHGLSPWLYMRRRVLQWFPHSVIFLWEILSPYIYERRKDSNIRWGGKFVYYASECLKEIYSQGSKPMILRDEYFKKECIKLDENDFERIKTELNEAMKYNHK